ncbi:MAG: sigma factor-like helix-turn-helix DNA-binding protein [Longibaculum sp.]
MLYLYYYEGYHIQEISEILQMNQNTIKSYLKEGEN